MSTSIAKRLIQLTYEWNGETKTHELTWDTDYPINVTGVFTKIFKAEQTYTVGDRITINGEEYEFQSLSGETPRSKIFKAGQYVPIAIDLDEKIVAYYSMAGGAGGGGSGSVDVEILRSDWSENYEFFIPIDDIHEQATVALMPEDGISEEELIAIGHANITATQTLTGIILKCQNKPTMDFHIQYVLV